MVIFRVSEGLDDCHQVKVHQLSENACGESVFDEYAKYKQIY